MDQTRWRPDIALTALIGTALSGPVGGVGPRRTAFRRLGYRNDSGPGPIPVRTTCSTRSAGRLAGRGRGSVAGRLAAGRDTAERFGVPCRTGRRGSSSLPAAVVIPAVNGNRREFVTLSSQPPKTWSGRSAGGDPSRSPLPVRLPPRPTSRSSRGQDRTRFGQRTWLARHRPVVGLLGDQDLGRVKRFWRRHPRPSVLDRRVYPRTLPQSRPTASHCERKRRPGVGCGPERPAPTSTTSRPPSFGRRILRRRQHPSPSPGSG